MQSLYYLIPAFVILLLLIPIILEVKVSFNALENSGVFCFYIFKIKIQYFFFELDGNQIKLKNEDETSIKQLDLNSPELALYEEFAIQLRDKARLKFLELYYNIGFDDAFLTSMICGLINIAALVFFTSLKNKKPTASLGVYDSVAYNKKVFEAAINLCVSLSLFDVVYSFVNSVILSRKKAKES